jgi:hypothetical protein
MGWIAPGLAGTRRLEGRPVRSVFDYVENDQLIALFPEKRLERLEALVAKGVVDDLAALAALLGTERCSGFLVSKLFEEYQSLIADEMKSMSPNQLRVWRLGRARAVRQFVEVTGDKPITDITQADGRDYVEWWRARIIAGEAKTKTASRDIGQLSRILKDITIRRRHFRKSTKARACVAQPTNRAAPSTPTSFKNGCSQSVHSTD